MKCRVLFSRKNKKNIISLTSAEFDHIMVNVINSFRMQNTTLPKHAYSNILKIFPPK